MAKLPVAYWRFAGITYERVGDIWLIKVRSRPLVWAGIEFQRIGNIWVLRVRDWYLSGIRWRVRFGRGGVNGSPIAT